MSREHDDSKPSRPNRRWWRIAVRVCIVLVMLVLASLAWCIYLLRSEPTYVTEIRAMMADKTPEQLHALAQSVQNKFASLTALDIDSETQAAIARGETTLLSTIGSEETIVLTLEELNAWLIVELPNYLEDHHRGMPPEVSRPGIATEAGQLVAFADVHAGGFTQVTSFLFSIRFHDEQPARIQLHQVRGGNMPLPEGAVRSRLGHVDPESSIAEIARMYDGISFDPVLEADDEARRFRVIAMQVNPRDVELTVRIEAK